MKCFRYKVIDIKNLKRKRLFYVNIKCKNVGVFNNIKKKLILKRL